MGVIRDAYIAIDGDQIVDLGPMSREPDYDARTYIDGTNRIALPGFINAHTHAVHVLLRGGPSDNRRLFDWLRNVLHPAAGQYSAKDARVAARLFCIESLMSGVTTVVDNSDLAVSDQVADATLSTYRASGLRAIYAPMFADYDPPLMADFVRAIDERALGLERPSIIESTSQALDRTERLMRRHHGASSSRLHVWPAPGVANLCSRAGLMGAKELARHWRTKVTVHVSETYYNRLIHGMSSIEYLNSIGFLDDQVLAAHCVHVDPTDIRMLAGRGVSVAYNPVSNMLMGSGIAPVMEMLSAGIRVGLGTDDCNANGTANILADMKYAVLAQRSKYLDAAAITADDALRMATLGGAAAIGMDDQIGSLLVGKKADVVLISEDHHYMVPRHDIPSALVYQTLGVEVASVFVDGQLLVHNRKLLVDTLADTSEFRELAQQCSRRIVEKGKIRPPTSY